MANQRKLLTTCQIAMKICDNFVTVSFFSCRCFAVGTCGDFGHFLVYIILYLRKKILLFHFLSKTKHNVWSLPLEKENKKQLTLFHTCPLHACPSGNLWKEGARLTDHFTHPRLSDSLFVMSRMVFIFCIYFRLLFKILWPKWPQFWIIWLSHQMQLTW